MRPQFWLVPILLTFSPWARADDWPQWLGPKRDSVWRETGILDKFPAEGPKVLWKAKIAGGYAGPAVAEGRVYLHDFLTDADTKKASTPTGRPKIEGKERILCFDAKSGDLLWKHEYPCMYEISYPAGPRCTPTVAGGKVYALGAMGHLICLEAVKGKVVWDKDLPKEYGAEVPSWGICGHPLIDGDKVILSVGGKGSGVVAFDKETGKEVWKQLTAKHPGYSPPTLIEAGGTKQLIIWHADQLHSLDPKAGDVHWSVPLAPFVGMAIMTPRQEGDFLFAAGMGKAVLLELAKDKPAMKEVWRGKDKTAVYPVNMTPFLEDGHIYGVDQQGQLRGVKLQTGERLWETTEPVTGERPANSGTAFLVKHADRFFLFNERGQLIIARLTPKGYEEISRAKILEPTHTAFGRDVVWSHPAFANRCMFARNDGTLVCVSLAAEGK